MSFGLAILVWADMLYSQITGPELEDPKITSVNTLKPHAWFIPFPNSKSLAGKFLIT